MDVVVTVPKWFGLQHWIDDCEGIYQSWRVKPYFTLGNYPLTFRK